MSPNFSSETVFIEPNCIFCGETTANVEKYTLYSFASAQTGLFTQTSFSSSLTVPFPAHQDCYQNNRRKTLLGLFGKNSKNKKELEQNIRWYYENHKQSHFDINIGDVYAKVKSLNFYEDGIDDNSGEKPREFGTYFAQSKARLIYWQLTLDFGNPTHSAPFDIEAIYYGPDGNILKKDLGSYMLREGKYHHWYSGGWGYREPGHWQIGTHKLEIRTNGKTIANSEFMIGRLDFK